MDVAKNFESDKSNTSLRCSFCGKHKEEVQILINAPNASICNECIDLCNEILLEEAGYSENYWIEQYKQYEREHIQFFINRNTRIRTDLEKLLQLMNKLNLSQKYQYEWNVLKEYEEFFIKYNNKKAFEHFENAIKLRDNGYLPYMFFIDKVWNSKENIIKVIDYCRHIKNIADKNKDYEILYRIDKIIEEYLYQLDKIEKKQF